MKSKFAKKKDEGGKKAEQKKKARKIADATFGLKNKNKSAKVQKFVQATEKSIRNGGDQKTRQEADKLKMAKANKRAAKKGTQNKLFEREACGGREVCEKRDVRVEKRSWRSQAEPPRRQLFTGDRPTQATITNTITTTTTAKEPFYC